MTHPMPEKRAIHASNLDCPVRFTIIIDCGREVISNTEKTSDPVKHYTALGLALGTCFGTVAGAVLGDVSIGLAVGLAIGLALGAAVGQSKKKQQGTAAKQD